jgi:hypothetical protein
MMKLLLLVAVATLIPATALAQGWAQQQPNGYTYGRTADGRSFWTQTTNGYIYGHVDPPLPSGHVDCVGATDPLSFARCFDGR